MSKIKILLIDDDTDLLTLMQINMAHSGFEVYTASQGQNGLSLVKSIMPDLVVSDIVMPEVNGYAFIREIKSDDEYSHIPIIAISGRDNFKDIILLEGADIFLPKPFSFEQLLNTIVGLLKI